MNEAHELKRMDRREAIKWMLAATATVSLLDAKSVMGAKAPSGYGTDPKMVDPSKPGDYWPLTFTAEEKRTAIALEDLIIPADEKSPKASDLHVHDFLDEWISAPYPRQQGDRKPVLEGLHWLEAESKKRFQQSFDKLDEGRQRQICDDICYVPKAKPEFKQVAECFAKLRNLIAGGFYSTPEGMKDIQYIGNVALTQFDGPPPEVLAYLKLA